MIKSKKELKFYLFADYYMQFGEKRTWSKKRYLKLLIGGLVGGKCLISRYLASMRWTAYYNNCQGGKRYFNPRYLFHAHRFNRLGVKLGFSIGYNCLGYGVVIPHYGTIVVNGDARLGNYCVLHTSTCIAGPGHIGDALYMSVGSIIVSPNLGDNVTLGANSLIHKSEPVSDVFMVGSPATIKIEDYPKWYDRDGWQSKVAYIEHVKKQINR